MRVRAVKWVLWFFAGAGAVAAVLRFWHGLGATTALSDTTPWGLWIGFDVMGGVALAAGGFLVAGATYVFRLEQYKKFARPAVLTAFLGYVAVAVGLLFDLGIPYNIVRPVVHWQHHSALFEVAWCVMLYLTVLGLEFAPVVLEKTRFARLARSLHRVALPLVIVGIALSTLHQSSLGTLMLLMPSRLHALWYSPLLPVLFFVSAVGLGLMMVTAESLVTGAIYKHKHETAPLAGLGRAASYVLALYAVLRIGDLAVRGQLVHLTDGSWQAALFLFEIGVAAVLPAILLSMPKVRGSRTGLAWCAGLVIGGFVLNRATTSGIATIAATGSNYVPALLEFTVSMAIVAAAALVFLFFVENFSVYGEHGDEATEEPVDPASDPTRLAFWRRAVPASSLRRYSLPFVGAAAIAFGVFPEAAIFGAVPERTPVRAARGADTLIIDGDRAGMAVEFDHAEHAEALGGRSSCVRCHHMSMPLDEWTSCAECHRDMFLETNIFDHDLHVAELGGNAGCARCHVEGEPRSAASRGMDCAGCHGEMRRGEFFGSSGEPVRPNFAVSYEDAMHGLCRRCHERQAAELVQPDLGRCAACHGDLAEPTRRAMERLRGARANPAD